MAFFSYGNNSGNAMSIQMLSAKSEFELVLQLANICANYKVATAQFGQPERDSTAPRDIQFWANWDYGSEIVDELVRRKKECGICVLGNKLWSYVASRFRDQYRYDYEYDRPVSLKADDFESLCAAIMDNNRISIGAHVLKPCGVDEITDSYGVDSLGMIWAHSHNNSSFEQLGRCDEWEVAATLFYRVNGRYPSYSDFGERAQDLDFQRWSIFDGDYIPLLKRLSPEPV